MLFYILRARSSSSPREQPFTHMLGFWVKLKFLLCIMIPTIVYLLYVLFIVDLYMEKWSIDIYYKKMSIIFGKKKFKSARWWWYAHIISAQCTLSSLLLAAGSLALRWFHMYRLTALHKAATFNARYALKTQATVLLGECSGKFVSLDQMKFSSLFLMHPNSPCSWSCITQLLEFKALDVRFTFFRTVAWSLATKRLQCFLVCHASVVLLNDSH